jgi:hypothetical protein
VNNGAEKYLCELLQRELIALGSDNVFTFQMAFSVQPRGRDSNPIL